MSKEKPERNIWNAQHIMLDIETLGGDAVTSPILAIAAMKFNPYAVTSKPFDEKYFEMDHIDEPREGIYYDTLNIHDQITHGRVMDLPTLEWWTNSPEKSSIINVGVDAWGFCPVMDFQLIKIMEGWDVEQTVQR